jgi:hypothetical protein
MKPLRTGALSFSIGRGEKAGTNAAATAIPFDSSGAASQPARSVTHKGAAGNWSSLRYRCGRPIVLAPMRLTYINLVGQPWRY